MLVGLWAGLIHALQTTRLQSRKLSTSSIGCSRNWMIAIDSPLNTSNYVVIARKESGSIPIGAGKVMSSSTRDVGPTVYGINETETQRLQRKVRSQS